MRAPDSEFDAWVARARDVPVEQAAELAGAKLRRSGADLVGPCPAGCCKTDGFVVTPAKALWYCRQSGATGAHDSIGLIQHALGLDFVGACQVLAGPPPERSGVAAPPRDPELDRERRDRRREDDLARACQEQTAAQRKHGRVMQFLEQRVPFLGSPAEAYMRRRGLILSAEQVTDLGFIADLEYWGYADEHSAEKTMLGTCPAMAAAMRRAGDRVTAVHFTYLDRREPRKMAPPGDARRNTAKKVFGQAKGSGIYLGPPCSCIALGEGIESVLSWYALGRVLDDVTPVAAYSLGNMSGSPTATRPHPGRPGASVPNGEPDMERPGIVLPGWAREVILVGDGDSEPVSTRAHMLTGMRRFEQLGMAVSVDMPPSGMDFSDLLMRGAVAA